jgi:nickel/cobalt transporter (NicO) family protein
VWALIRWFIALLILATVLLVTPVSFHVVSAEGVGKAEPAPFDKRRLLVQPRNADGTIIVMPFREDPLLWLRGQQRNYYKSISGALRGLGGEHAASAGFTLALLSFLYGILHAAGPGHGKAVISAWLLATESQLRRGIFIAFLSSVIQAMTAIVVVCGLLLIFQSAGAMAKDAAKVLEAASYGLIALTGFYLIWTGLKAAGFGRAAPVAAVSAGPQAHHFEIVNPLPPNHIHGPDCGCDHAHLPAAKDLDGDWSFAKAASLSFAVGIRPCSGSILVLVFANTLGLLWAGILSTFVMSLGTFITVSCIATLAVYSKKLAERLFSGNAQNLTWLATALRLGGGTVIVLMGTFLFFGSLGGQGANF